MWGLYVDYNRSAVGHIYAMCQAYLFRAYASNVKVMYTTAPGHIVDCIKFIWGTYTDIVAAYEYMK